jgi:CRP-like cAMP-binding protein
MANPLLKKLAQMIALSASERAAIGEVPLRLVTIRADQDIVREGDRPSRCAMIVGGISCTAKVTGSGRRQITAFHIAGDIPDLMSLHLDQMDSDIQTVTECEVAFIDHAAVRFLCERHWRIAAALWRSTLIDAAIFREWTVNVKRRSPERLAHLFCEVMARMEAAGLVTDRKCQLRLTQGDLSEATGMSPVHVNRTLQALRSGGLISFGNGELTIHDWEGLASLGDFVSDYLHLPQDAILTRDVALS